jgi:hypothetical protein
MISAAIWSGIRVEDRLHDSGMPAATAPLTGQLTPFLFAFGFPSGVALLALATQFPPPRSGARRWARGVFAGLAVTAPIMVPTVASRGLVPWQFGAGGTTIAVCAVLALWLLGRIRRAVPAALIGSVDLAIGALACFAMAAWNLCGSAAMPSFLLDPETVLRLGTLPFAIGQMKSVLALLVAGWVLVLIATWRALAFVRKGQGQGR